MKKIIVTIISVFVIILGINSFAGASMQGEYLRDGSCTITAGTGHVYVSGETNAFEPVDEVTIVLELYQEESPGSWNRVWSDSLTANNSDHVTYKRKKVNVDSGYNYMIVSTHSIKNGSYYESNENETAARYVD